MGRRVVIGTTWPRRRRQSAAARVRLDYWLGCGWLGEGRNDSRYSLEVAGQAAVITGVSCRRVGQR